MQTDGELDAHIREHAESAYHPCGTCRMGRADDPMAVTNPTGRVHGTHGLRVADASIMPTMVSSNTNAPSFMIGERCAQFLLDDAQANATPESMR